MQLERVNYRFARSPVELSREWHDGAVSFYERLVGRELHVVIGDAPQPHAGDWRETACRLMAVSGRDRTTAKRALQALLDRGLISADENTFSVHFAVPKATVSTQSDDVQTTVRRRPDDTQIEAKVPESHVGTERAISEEREKREDLERDSEGDRACATPVRKAPSSSLVQQFDEMFRAEAHARQLRPAPSLTSPQRLAAIERVREMAPDVGGLEVAARSLLKAAFDDSAATGQKIGFALLECQPGRPAQLRVVRGGRIAPAPPAPHSAFDNQPDDAEIVLARMIAERAAKAAQKAGTA